MESIYCGLDCKHCRGSRNHQVKCPVRAAKYNEVVKRHNKVENRLERCFKAFERQCGFPYPKRGTDQEYVSAWKAHYMKKWREGRFYQSEYFSV